MDSPYEPNWDSSHGKPSIKQRRESTTGGSWYSWVVGSPTGWLWRDTDDLPTIFFTGVSDTTRLSRTPFTTWSFFSANVTTLTNVYNFGITDLFIWQFLARFFIRLVQPTFGLLITSLPCSAFTTYERYTLASILLNQKAQIKSPVWTDPV